MSVLFEPVQIGDLQLANRVIMAPLTRSRGTGTDNRVPNDLMATYYSQRSNAGLIISEATAVTPMGVGYARTPGIWSDEQVQGWKKVTSAVHAKGGKILLQLWHVGRISHPMFLNGELPVAPSAIVPSGHVSLVRPEKAYVTPRALETSEIPGIVEAFRKGAENAKAAGFDGVEIHGANGYLIDQFLQDSTNHRTDQYGGSIENRARFALEIADAVISVWGAGRVGFHIAPRGDGHTMGDSNPVALFTYLASELAKRKIAFICAREYQDEDSIGDKIKAAFGGAYIANEKFTQESAEALINSGGATAVAFGSKYIANPDLLARFQQGLPLAEVHWDTVYGATAVGYTDYPAAT
ncbi:alkene reductase [Cellvibrio zantedeschiae]|uniref:Alkene reductase n=1 Tax=Cellvibrio zantedeschiae TaxID=1237077 RepID=A0ABQ3BF16_9GAMM|nr:alkene reductase [Cellvibrio zantedeschiae]GGY88602.1 alkene reductase [Cellvibrio zantedeschiae]